MKYDPKRTLPILRNSLPIDIAKDLMSAQKMSSSVGHIFVLKNRYKPFDWIQDATASLETCWLERCFSSKKVLVGVKAYKLKRLVDDIVEVRWYSVEEYMKLRLQQ